MGIKITDAYGQEVQPAQPNDRLLVLYDIDNVLYSKNAGVDGLMKEKIEAYFVGLGLDVETARELRHRYYTEYGLAIRGLVRHHQVDPLDYDRQCDAALPLETVLRPDPNMQALLRDIDRTKFQVWALTNAYYNHATRVLRLLELSEYFEGVVSCDYAAKEFSCKPEEVYFNDALAAAGSPDPSRVYFVDDSALNIKGAHGLRWGHCVLFDEHGDQRERLGGIDRLETDGPGKVSVIEDMQELRQVWPEMFVSRVQNGHGAETGTNGRTHD